MSISQNQLRTLINQMVEQAIGEKMGSRQASWQSGNSSYRASLSYDRPNSSRSSGGFDFSGVGGSFRGLGNTFQKQANYRVENLINKRDNYINDVSKGRIESGPHNEWMVQDYDDQIKRAKDSSMMTFGKVFSGVGMAIQGIGALQNAYRNKDPLSGAMAGASMFTGIGGLFRNVASNPGTMAALGWVGMGLGLLTGLFGKSKKIDEWQKPKFKQAEKAYNKLFTVDRGEEDLYYMPESFYFRTGWQGPRHVVVKVGNGQFDNHIRESLTSSYATQLQRGLVF